MGSNDLLDSDELRGRIWRGNGGVHSARAALPTGFVALDRYLPGGGWPLGPLIEVFVERYGVGELSLLMPALAALTTRREGSRASRKWVAWIAPPFVPYAPALQQRGVAVDALLLVHPSGKECLWTVEQVIRSGSSCGVLAWLAAADHVALRRLQLASEAQGCWTILFRPMAARHERSPAALRLGLEQGRSTVRARIDKCRGAWPALVDMGAVDIDEPLPGPSRSSAVVPLRETAHAPDGALPDGAAE